MRKALLAAWLWASPAAAAVDIQWLVPEFRGSSYIVIQSRHTPMRLDLQTRRLEPLRRARGTPEPSWPTGLAVDTRRGRVLMIDFGGEGHLYAYDLRGKTLRALGSMRDKDMLGLAYLGSRDSVYSLLPNPEGYHIARLGPRGEIEESVRLDPPFWPEPHPHELLQLAGAGERILLMSSWRGREQDPPAIRFYTVDVDSGRMARIMPAPGARPAAEPPRRWWSDAEEIDMAARAGSPIAPALFARQASGHPCRLVRLLAFQRLAALGDKTAVDALRGAVVDDEAVRARQVIGMYDPNSCEDAPTPFVEPTPEQVAKADPFQPYMVADSRPAGPRPPRPPPPPREREQAEDREIRMVQVGARAPEDLPRAKVPVPAEKGHGAAVLAVRAPARPDPGLEIATPAEGEVQDLPRAEVPVPAEKEADVAVPAVRAPVRPEPAGEVAAPAAGEVEALARPQAVPAHPELSVRAKAILLEGRVELATHDAIPDLIEALKKGAPRIRALAADLLGKMLPPAEAAVEPLLAALEDEDNGKLRSNAAIALGNIGVKDRKVMRALERAKGDKDPDVRYSAKKALERLSQGPGP